MQVDDAVRPTGRRDGRDEAVAPEQSTALGAVPGAQPAQVVAPAVGADRHDVGAERGGGVEDLGGRVGRHDGHRVAEVEQGLGVAQQHLLAAAEVGVVGGEVDPVSHRWVLECVGRERLAQREADGDRHRGVEQHLAQGDAP